MKIKSIYSHNEMTNVVPDYWIQKILPPSNKPIQHISCKATDVKGISIFKNHQAHQHHTDIQLFVILEKKKKRH